MWIYAEPEPMLSLMLLVIVGIVALYWKPGSISAVRKFKVAFRRLANQPWKCAAILFLGSLAINFGLSCCRPATPWIHDEYSYLLASDTFASGRLTNPPHPLWEHFESFHVLSQPSYMSKYPPASGLFMAVAEVVTGHPIVGIWFALAAATVALFWMLRAWTTPVWALWGATLVATNGWLIHAWGQSYWGGAVAFLGGALLYGGVRRITKSAKIIDAVLLGMGLLILANSRPMEGFLVSLPVIGVLLFWFFKSSEFSLQRKLTHAALPIIGLGLIGLGAMGVYNKAVTGSYVELPYRIHDATYSASGLSLWKAPPEVPSYNHDRMRTFYVDWARARQLSLQESTSKYWHMLLVKFKLLGSFFPLALGMTFLVYPVLLKDRWCRLGIITIAALLLIHCQMAFSMIFPHYLAPATALFFAISVIAIRHIRVWERQSRLGSRLVGVALVYGMLSLVPLFVSYQKPTRLHPRQSAMQVIEDSKVDATEQGHLVIVSYSDRYRVSDEWVYNKADIDAAGIVWARDMGTEKNARLLKYFAGRKLWRWTLEDDETMMLREYNGDGLVVKEMHLVDSQFVERTDFQTSLSQLSQ